VSFFDTPFFTTTAATFFDATHFLTFLPLSTDAALLAGAGAAASFSIEETRGL
jgi:hypothetical protein